MELDKLQEFIHTASTQTYASGGDATPNPERKDFEEFPFVDGDFSYLDSYTGYVRSHGTEVVRFQGKPVWYATYGGGMLPGKEDLAHETFGFLKKAFLERVDNSFRGPGHFSEGDFTYTYKQEGDIKSFKGHEEILKQGQQVFEHDIIGGLLIF